MKRYLSICFAVMVLAQATNSLWMIVSFKLNQTYIAQAYCVNKTVAITVCGGKCYLVETLRQEQDNQTESLPQGLGNQVDVVFIAMGNPQGPAPVGLESISPTAHYRNPFQSKLHTLDVFHPPKSA